MTQKSSVRIIAGKWRSRKLPILELPGLRPTGDRVRETLFNWLMNDINGCQCLDLFAGTGVLGLEALSRGAAEAHFVESEATVARQLQSNLATLQSTNGKVHNVQAASWLENHCEQFTNTFDIVFIDPPFSEDLWQTTLNALEKSKILKPDAFIYVEQPKEKPQYSNNLTTIKEKTTGKVRFGLYQLAVSK